MSTVIGGSVVWVHIEWMDGEKADIRSAGIPSAHEGVLQVWRYDARRPNNTGRKVCYPVANIRFWEPDAEPPSTGRVGAL